MGRLTRTELLRLVGSMCCRTARATSDGFSNIGQQGHEIVRLLNVGFKLSSWTDGVGVISDWDCR